jgi:hypothetical protein
LKYSSSEDDSLFIKFSSFLEADLEIPSVAYVFNVDEADG